MRPGQRPPLAQIHRMLLPGHPARWLMTLMAGLLTCGSWLPPPSRPRVRGQWLPGGARRLQLRGQLRVWRLMPTPHRIPFSPDRAWLGREPSRPDCPRMPAPSRRIFRRQIRGLAPMREGNGQRPLICGAHRPCSGGPRNRGAAPEPKHRASPAARGAMDGSPQNRIESNVSCAAAEASSAAPKPAAAIGSPITSAWISRSRSIV